MARHPVTAVLPNGSTYQISRQEAAQAVAQGARILEETDRLYKRIEITPELVIRGLSARIGEGYAKPFRQRQMWAEVAVAQIRKQWGPMRGQQDEAN